MKTTRYKWSRFSVDNYFRLNKILSSKDNGFVKVSSKLYFKARIAVIPSRSTKDSRSRGFVKAGTFLRILHRGAE